MRKPQLAESKDEFLEESRRTITKLMKGTEFTAAVLVGKYHCVDKKKHIALGTTAYESPQTSALVTVHVILEVALVPNSW